MFYLANIYNISKDDILFDDIKTNILFPYLNITLDINDIDRNIPTLIVGYKKAMEIINKSLDINDNKINEITYYCFSLDESKKQFHKQFLSFIKNISEMIFYKKEYKIIDTIFTSNIYNTDKLVEYVKTLTFNIYYESKNVIYLYSVLTNLTYSIDLNLFNHLGYDTDLIKTSIVCDKKIIDGNGKINYFFKILFPEKIEILDRIIPYLISLKK